MFMGFFALFIALAILLVMWAAASIPVYLAAKALTGGRASIWGAMAATLLGAFVYSLVSWTVLIAFGVALGTATALLGSILAFLALLWVYKSVFRTGWLQAFGVAVLAAIIMAAIVGLLGALTLLPLLVR